MKCLISIILLLKYIYYNFVILLIEITILIKNFKEKFNDKSYHKHGGFIHVLYTCTSM